MPHVIIYKPNGDQVMSTNIKRFEYDDGALTVYLEDDMADYYGPTVTTTLPHFIQSKAQS